MNTRTAYDSWSETYDRDRNLTRDLDHVVTRATLSHLRFSSILEIGCGTGKNTALLASIGAKVHALDFSDGMLAQAKTKVSSDNVTFTVADLTRPWPCAAQSADLVVCNLVLEHIGDLRSFLQKPLESWWRMDTSLFASFTLFGSIKGPKPGFNTIKPSPKSRRLCIICPTSPMRQTQMAWCWSDFRSGGTRRIRTSRLDWHRLCSGNRWRLL